MTSKHTAHVITHTNLSKDHTLRQTHTHGVPPFLHPTISPRRARCSSKMGAAVWTRQWWTLGATRSGHEGWGMGVIGVTRAHACAIAHTHAHARAHTHIYKHTYAHTNTNTHPRAHTQTHHARTHTNTHTRAHTNTHTRAQVWQGRVFHAAGH